jgi:hypothetical protein
MAIAIDSTSSGMASAGTTVTVSHTVSGSQRMLVVGVATNGAVPSGVTFNGVAMTLKTSGNSGGNISSVWYLAAPDVGTFNIVVTKGSGVGTALGGISFTGADPVIGGSNNASGTSATASTIVTVAGTSGYVVDCVWTGNPTPSVGAGQTQYWSLPNFASSTRDAAGSYELHAGGSTTMSWTLASDAWAISAVEVKAAPPVTSGFFNFMRP